MKKKDAPDKDEQEKDTQEKVTQEKDTQNKDAGISLELVKNAVRWLARQNGSPASEEAGADPLPRKKQPTARAPRPPKRPVRRTAMAPGAR